MNYFGVNRKIPVENKYWEGPKERLKQNEVVTHLIIIDHKTLEYVPKNWDSVLKSYRTKFDVNLRIKFDSTYIYLTGKRKELQEEFGKLNEVRL